MRISRLILTGCAVLALSGSAVGGAEAAILADPSLHAQAAPSDVEAVYWRRGWRRGGWYRGPVMRRCAWRRTFYGPRRVCW